VGGGYECVAAAYNLALVIIIVVSPCFQSPFDVFFSFLGLPSLPGLPVSVDPVVKA
jgi:hypothetical protein